MTKIGIAFFFFVFITILRDVIYKTKKSTLAMLFAHNDQNIPLVYPLSPSSLYIYLIAFDILPYLGTRFFCVWPSWPFLRIQNNLILYILVLIISSGWRNYTQIVAPWEAIANLRSFYFILIMRNIHSEY